MKKNYPKKLLMGLILMLPVMLNAQMVLLDESFENGIPTDWSHETVVGSVNWATRSCDSFLFPSGNCPSGNFCVYFQTNNPSSSVSKLITPPLSAAAMGESNLILSYALPAFPDGTSDKLLIYSRKSTTADWELLKEITFSSYSWRKEIISIPRTSTSNQFQLAFEGVDQHGRGIMLDGIRLESEYICPIPSGLRTVGLNHNSTTLMWTGIDELITYEIKIDTKRIEDFELPAWRDDVTAENNYFISGLEPNTTYYFYVRSNCDTYGKSAWSEAGVFTTACSTIESLNEGFESFEANLGQGGAKIGCWSSHVTASIPTLSITNAYYPYVYNGSGYTKYGTKTVRLYGYYSSSAGYTTCYFISPGISETVNLKEKQLRFSVYCTNVNHKLHIGIMDGPSDFASYTEIRAVNVKKASSSTNKGEEIIVPLDAYSGNGKYIVFSVSGGDVNATVTMYLDEIRIEPLYECGNTKILETTVEPDINNATIEWKPIKTERWHVKIATKQIDPEKDEVDGIVYNNDNITGSPRIQPDLNTNTTYYYYIRPICDDSTGGIWSDEYSFKTLCGIQSIPYFDGFEDYTAVSSYNSTSPSIAAFPSCWYRYDNISTTYDFPYVTSTTSSGYIYAGAKAMSFYSSPGSSEIIYAVTPEINMENYDNIQLSFYGRKASASGTVTIGFMTDPQDISTYEEIQTIKTTSISTYEKIIIPLTGYQGNAKHIAFFCKGSQFYLDNFSVEYIPVCTMPDVEMSATERGTNTITVEFEPDAGLNSYDVAYAMKGFNPNEPAQSTIINVSENKATITGLTPVTQYDIYVRGNCGEGNVTPWQGPLLVQTRQVEATVPYFCNFVSGDGRDDAANWTLVNGTQGNKWIVGTNAYGNEKAALYISSGDEKYEYSSTTSTVHAVRAIYLEQGKYNISYKWKANGQGPSTDFMRAFLVPEDYVVLENDNNGIAASTAIPADWIDLAPGAGGLMVLEKDWKTAERVIDIAKNGKYQLLFHWRNNNSTQNQPPAAVDSISIVKNTTTCSTPSSLQVLSRAESGLTIDFAAPNTSKWEVRISEKNLGVDAIGAEKDEDLAFKGEFTQKPIQITGLKPAKTYYYYVKSIVEGGLCNEYVAGGKFGTIGVIDKLPYFEGFEGYSTGVSGDFVPGWSKLGAGGVYPTTLYPRDGEQSLSLNATVGNSCMAITPRIDVEDISKLRVIFYERFSNLSSYMVIGVIDNPADFATFLPVDTVYPTEINTQEYNCVWLDSYKGQGKYIAFYLPGESSPNTPYMDNLTIELAPTCKEAADLVATTITRSSATLSWETDAPKVNLKVSTKPIYVFENNVADVYDLKALEATGNTYDISNLKPNRTYYFYVQAICSESDISAWSLVGEFKTECSGIASVPFRESFDTYGTGGLIFLDCWHLVSENITSTTTTYPYIYGSNSYSTPGNLYFTSKELIPNVIATPELNVADISKLIIKFYGRSANLTHPLTVGVMSDISDPESFVAIKTVFVDKTSTWQEFTISLKGYKGSGKHVAFKVEGGAYSFYIDDLKIEEEREITCEVADRLRTIRVSANSARLGWGNVNNGAFYFNLKYSTDPIEDPYNDNIADVVRVDSINDIYYTINGLKSGTKYYFTIQAICGENDLSYWAEPVEFTTLCGVVDLPYVESFENYGTPLPGTSSFTDRSIYPFCWRNDVQNIRMGTSTSYIYPPYITSDNGAGNLDPQSKYHLGFEPYYSSSDEKYTIVTAVTPEINVEYIRDCQVTFSYSSPSTSNGVLVIGVMSDYMDAGTFFAVDTIYTKGETEWKWHTTNFRNYPRTGKYIAFSSSGLNNGGSIKILMDNITISKTPDCAVPVKIKVENVGLQDATFSWTPGNDKHSNWDYVITIDPVIVTGSEEDWIALEAKAIQKGTISTNSLSLNSLTPGTEYYLYLRASCSETTYTLVPTKFMTECSSIDIFPYTQVFTSSSTELVGGYNSTYVPCWFRLKEPFLYATMEPRIWSVSYNDPSGLSVKDTSLLFNASSLYREYAISPQLEVADISKINVSFWARKSSASYDVAEIVVGVMTNPADHKTFVAVDTVAITPSTEYVEKMVSLSTYKGNGKYVALATIQKVLTSGFYVKEITLDNPPCIKPLGLNVVNNSPTSLTIDWEKFSTTKWEIAYGPVDVQPDDMTNKIVTEDNPHTLSGLSANTRYAIYVRSICDNDTSEWSSPYITITNQTPAPFPFVCSFEEQGDAEGWTLLNSNHTNQWIVGDATSLEGNGNSLYISNDTSSYMYSPVNSKVIAYRILEAPKGKLKISYKWKSLGATSAYLRAVIAPLETSLIEGADNGLGNSYSVGSGASGKVSDIHPEGWINIGPTSYTSSGGPTTYTYGMSGQQEFTQYVANEINVPKDTAYKLIFYWANSTSGTSSNRPASIDSVRFEYSDYCSPAENFSVTKFDGSTIFMHWEGYNTSKWEIKISKYYSSTNPWNVIGQACVVDTIIDVNNQRPVGTRDTAYVTLSDLLLEAGETYSIYVKPACNSAKESWAFGARVSKPCSDIYTALREDFEAKKIPPTCWNVYGEWAKDVFDGKKSLTTYQETGYWGGVNSNYGIAGGYATLTFARNIYYDTKNWLVTPIIKLEQETALTFDFSVFYYSGGVKPVSSLYGEEQFIVAISDDEGETWKRENATVWNSTDGNYPFRNLLSVTPKQYSIDLAQYKGKNIRIAFYGETNRRVEGTNFVGILDNVEVNCVERHDFNDTAMQGYPYEGYGFNLDGSELNFGGDTILHRVASGASSQCDSLIYLKLSVKGAVYNHINGSVCQGKVYTENGFNEFKEGTYQRYYTTDTGSDSIVVLNLKVNPTYQIHDDIIACPSVLPITWRGKSYSKAGTYSDPLISSCNCDSTYILNLKVENSIHRDVEKTICVNDVYMFDGKELNKSGVYTATFQNSVGCDSTVTLTLTVTDDIRVEKEVRICPNASFTGYGWENLTESDEYVHRGFSQSGCDSTFVLRLYISRQLYTYLDATICEGGVYNQNGFNTSVAGIHQIKYQAVNGGCDSIVVLTLDVVPELPETYIDATICAGDVYNENGFNTSTPGEHKLTFQSVNGGCDSVIILTLTVVPEIPITNDAVTIKESDLPYNYKNQHTFPIGTKSGNYTVTFKSVQGCDSVVNLKLTVGSGVGVPYLDVFANELIIEPNPINAGGQVQLKYNFVPEDFQNMKVEVFNGLGVCVHINYLEKEPVVLSNLHESGVYMIRITTGRNKVLYGKLIVQ